MRSTRCGEQNSTPRGSESPRSLAMAAMPSTALCGMVFHPRQANRGSQAGTGRTMFSASRSGTRPATRCRRPPAVSAAMTTFTGRTQPSRAASTSATVRARSSLGSAANPRSGSACRGLRRLSAAPSSSAITDPRAVCDDFDRRGFAFGDLDRLGPRVRGLPAVGAERLDRTVLLAAQALVEQVLGVGHGVGDAPGDRARVPEVRDAGDPRHRETDHVETVGAAIGAGQPDLLVGTGKLEEPVRVPARSGAPEAVRVPSRIQPFEPVGAGPSMAKRPTAVLPEMRDDALAPELGGETGPEEQVLGVPDRQGRPGFPSRWGACEFGGGSRRFRQGGVDARDIRADPVGRLVGRGGRRRRARRRRPRSGGRAGPRAAIPRRRPRPRSRWRGG